MFKRKHGSTKQTGADQLRFLGAMVLLFCFFLSSCIPLKPAASQASIDLTGVFPAANTIPGWVISKKVETYDHDHLFNLVDGQADSFFVYGFEKVAVQRYQNDAGVLLNVEIWQLATHADAYGLFSAGRTGSPVAVGNAGASDPGRRLAFWQNRYFVSLNAAPPVPDETLMTFAQAIAGVLPAGGEPPAIVNHLPRSGLVEQGSIFFHEEMSIQMEVWLGGNNLLGLSQATNGVVGRYTIGSSTARLLLIEYPSSNQASMGLKALQGGNLSNLVASDAQGNQLGAVFGKLDTTQAQTLLREALK